MDFEKSLKVTVTEADQRRIQVVVESGSALIGSGGHCDIRLGQEHVSVEQLFLEIQPGGLFAEARSNTPQVLVDGVPSSGSNSPPFPEAMLRAISKRRLSCPELAQSSAPRGYPSGVGRPYSGSPSAASALMTGWAFAMGRSS